VEPETGTQESRRERRAADDRRRHRRLLGLGTFLAIVGLGMAVAYGTNEPPTPRSPRTTLRPTPVTTTTVPTTTSSTVPPPTDADLVAPKPAQPVVMPPGVQVVSRIRTADRVVFLTIDDGMIRDPEFTARFVKAGIPITMFPTASLEREDPAFFKAWIAAGAQLGNHTVTHPNLRTLGQAAQQREICGNGDTAQELFGQRPTLFRPPFGNHNAATAAAVQACGMRYIILWHTAINEGRVQFQEGTTLQPGDIILMHWRTTFDEDFDAAIAKARADGMKFAYLRDYLPS